MAYRIIKLSVLDYKLAYNELDYLLTFGLTYKPIIKAEISWIIQWVEQTYLRGNIYITQIGLIKKTHALV